MFCAFDGDSSRSDWDKPHTVKLTKAVCKLAANRHVSSVSRIPRFGKSLFDLGREVLDR